MNQVVEKEADAELLFEEMRAERGASGKAPDTVFQQLPDGVYQGRVYIVPNKVSNPDSPN